VGNVRDVRVAIGTAESNMRALSDFRLVAVTAFHVLGYGWSPAGQNYKGQN
jgi:hypothetical protein